MTLIIEYPNLFTDLEQKNIVEYFDTKISFTFAGSSSSTPNVDTNNGRYIFWKADLMDNIYFTNHLLKKIEKVTNRKYKLDDVYINGHTYGIPGYPHQDMQTPEARTFLYYLVSKWDVRWGGKTCFDLSTDEKKEYKFVVPEPNKGVLFDGNLIHWAEDVSRDYIGLRMTLAWKLIEI